MSEVNQSEQIANSTEYKVWAVDNVVYGPVDYPTLSKWISDERVTQTTWIYHSGHDTWHKASHYAELKTVFEKLAAATSEMSTETAVFSKAGGIKTGALRRLKILASLDESQLERIKHYMTHQVVKQFSVIVKQGDPGDAMFMILDGETRVRFMVGGKETILATLSVGDFFGELCLFDHGPRSADVVANVDTELLRMTAASFQQLLVEEPELAAPFLSAVCKTLAARMRASNKRLRDVLVIRDYPNYA